ncbi:MAG: hypothetical protein FGM14_09055 [Flavobacteriales bacterium]|nr:hypothetical protein [Flavobacteriales bacterium]
MKNILENLADKWLNGHKEYSNDLDFSNEFYEIEIIGNKRTGNQIDNWESVGSLEVEEAFKNWDGKTELKFDFPEKGEIEIFNNLLKYDNLPSKIPDIGSFVLFKSSKVTDFINGGFVSQFGVIVNEKVKDILIKYNLGKHQFYPLKIKHKDEYYKNYFLFKTLSSADNFINIEESIFYKQRAMSFDIEDRIDIKFNNQSEIDDFTNENKKLDYSSQIWVYSKQIKLNSNFPKQDIFYLKKYQNSSDSSLPLISERLKKELEKNGITGVTFEKTKRII